jgi:HlyD family secretion protein
MKKKLFRISNIVYAVLGCSLFFGLWLLFKEKPIEVETAKVVRGDFEENLRADGIIKAKKKVTVLARANGDLGRVDLKVGEEIKKGQKITDLIWDQREAIKSPITGIISKVYRESAGPINRGDPLIDIINPEDLQVESEILTTDAIRIPLNAPVKIYGLGNELIQSGTVKQVSRAGFVKLSALGVEEEKTLVYIQIINPQRQLLGDTYHVELSILLDAEKKVLKIPIGSIFKTNNQWTVYTLSKNRADLKKILILKRNDSEAVIDEKNKDSDALKENETVILFPGDQIFQGTLVKNNSH